MKRSEERRDGELPWIVVGDREKLATDGPTLALNFAARSALLRTSHLAVIGYSFSDNHINAMIRDWLAADEARTMSILDVAWPREGSYRPSLDFRSSLIAEFAHQQGYDGEVLSPRVLPIEGRTAELMSDVLSARPAPPPSPLAEIATVREDSAIRIDITWRGADLADATVNVTKPQGASPRHYGSASVPLYDTPPRSPNAHREAWSPVPTRERWPTDATMTVYAAAETDVPFEVKVHGASILGALQWTQSVGAELLPPPGDQPAEPEGGQAFAN